MLFLLLLLLAQPLLVAVIYSSTKQYDKHSHYRRSNLSVFAQDHVACQGSQCSMQSELT